MSVTLDVSQPVSEMEVRDEQCQNIEFISVTFWVSQSERLRVARDEQPENM